MQMGISSKTVDQLFVKLDVSGDGTILKDEFTKVHLLCPSIKGGLLVNVYIGPEYQRGSLSECIYLCPDTLRVAHMLTRNPYS